MNTNENYIINAVEQFEKLLREQYARAEKMKNAPCATDYASLDKIIIGCCGGDGIGPIITAEARRVLEYLLSDAITAGKVELRDIDGLTIENRIACDKAIPDDVLSARATIIDLVKRNPKNGLVVVSIEAYNQNGELVLKDVTEAIVKCRQI